ncbi:ABC transporter permease [Chachezhania sediminis]|uniref:ABC transporter permease n=1 Tax=Chachezhania sediminis TaxID=2599291 RepID=UPI00131DCB67|nr:ABC transporter permease [Chachezhania sediminis]
MKLVVLLALRDLAHQKIHLICNIAILAGVLVPLLVLFGVKNGVYDAMIGRLLSNPATLQIDTAGNENFSAADAETVRSWSDAGFVTLKTRSLFDYVNVRPVGGREKRDALLIPSGTGDPNLPAGLVMGPDDVAISATLAQQLAIEPGTQIQIFTQADDRPRQLALTVNVVAVLPPDRSGGRNVLAGIDVLDLVEAFYDSYALPDHGITQGRPLEQRAPVFEGLRVFARDLQSLAGLQARMEREFAVRTEAQTTQVEAILSLGRNLNLALLFTTAVAGIGLAAALIFGFWGEVARKRQVLAALALLGIGGRSLWLFPVVQALASGVLGLAFSFGLFRIAGSVAERLFDSGLTEAGGLVSLGFAQGATIALLVLVFVTGASFFAARQAGRTDPAEVLRQGVT